MKLNLGCGRDLREGYLNLDKKETNLEEKLPFGDKIIEEIVLQNVIEHVVNHKQLLQECYRILNDEGVLLISTTNYTSLLHRLKFGIGIDTPLRDYNHVRFFSYKMFIEEIKEAGFKIKEIKVNSLTLSFMPAQFAGNIKIKAKRKEAKNEMLSV